MKKAYVINIMNEKNIIIDYGYDSGAKIGDKVRIIEQGEPITNLKGQKIGTLDLIKENVEIVEAYPSFSVCQKIIEKSIPSIFGSALSQINLSNTERSVEPMDVYPNDITNLSFPKLTPIKKGDIVEIL